MSVPNPIEQDDPPAPRGAPLISVAFVAAILFVPFVIATGLLTDDPPAGSSPTSDITFAGLRGSFEDAAPLRLRQP